MLSLIYSIAYTQEAFTDPRDGNVKKIVKIGSQVWIAENLRYMPSGYVNVTLSD